MTSPEITIIGTGLIGTSIAMAAAQRGSHVRGFDLDGNVLRMAAERSGLEIHADAVSAASGADIIFVCAPVSAIPQEVVQALQAAPEAIVSDAGSVKQAIVAGVAAAGVSIDRFVGGHPMSGTERSGPDTASGALLDGATWVLTPGEDTDPACVASLQDWIAGVGANVIKMSAADHDRIVAVVSHAPQMAATALMNLASRQDAQNADVLTLAAGGFRDLTRLAASNPALWTDIMRANREEVSHAVGLLVDELEGLRRALNAGDSGELEAKLEAAKAARLALAAKPKVRAGVAIIQVAIPDQPGALANLTRALGEASVNIEDMQIVHSAEGGRGSVQVTVAVDDADAAAAALVDSDPSRIA